MIKKEKVTGAEYKEIYCLVLEFAENGSQSQIPNIWNIILFKII